MQPSMRALQGQRLSTAPAARHANCDRPPPQQVTRCMSSKGPGGPGAQSAKAVREETYPNESLDFSPEDGLLPMRQPGNFPAAAVAAPAAPEVPGVSAEPEAEYDPLRNGPLRYLGYSNECGEAFAAWIPSWGVPLSYGVAISYVLVDTYDKWNRARKQARAELGASDLDPAVNEDRLVNLIAADRAVDTVVWQLLASVAIPGYTIHTVVAAAHALLLQAEATEQLQNFFVSAAPGLNTTAEVLAGLFDKTLPTMIGLAAIPFIVHPIDEGVHAIMNASLRPAVKKFLCAQGQGKLAGLALCADCEREAEEKK